MNHPKLRARIEIECKFPVFVGGLQNGAAVNHTCAIEQRVNARYEGHLLVNVVFVHHIKDGRVNIGNPCIAFEQFRVDIGGPDCGALCRHGHDRSVTNALARSSYQNVFVFKSHV